MLTTMNTQADVFENVIRNFLFYIIPWQIHFCPFLAVVFCKQNRIVLSRRFFEQVDENMQRERQPGAHRRADQTSPEPGRDHTRAHADAPRSSNSSRFSHVVSEIGSMGSSRRAGPVYPDHPLTSVLVDRRKSNRGREIRTLDLLLPKQQCITSA